MCNRYNKTILKEEFKIKKKNILLVYDNCKSHISGFSGWWMRNIDCIKLTICPYTPEFNPVERFFNTIKRRASDGVIRKNIKELTRHFTWHINQIPRNTFISYF